jgi:hypothetical protein
MPKMSGAEASDLAYLAECPNAQDRDEVISNLSSPLREIALILTGQGTGNESDNAKKNAEAIIKWAKRKRCDHWWNEVCVHCEDKKD